MQINLSTNYTQRQNFGMSVRVTEKATRHLKSRFMSPKDIKRFEKVIKRFDEKGDFIEGTLDEFHGGLVASIYSDGRYSENVYEGTFSRLFRSPINFIEEWAGRADKVEAKLKNDVKLEEIANKYNK